MRFFSFFVANKIFQSFFTKRDFIGYCYFILLRSIFFIEIGSSFWWNIFFFLFLFHYFLYFFFVFFFQFQYHEVLYFLLLLYVLSKKIFFSYVSGNEKIFTSCLKNSCFVCLGFFIFLCFHFFSSSFLIVFISFCF